LLVHLNQFNEQKNEGGPNSNIEHERIHQLKARHSHGDAIEYHVNQEDLLLDIPCSLPLGVDDLLDCFLEEEGVTLGLPDLL